MRRHHLITSAELVQALAGARPPLVVDVRDRRSYEAGHVPGSACIPVHDLATRRADLPASLIRRIVLIGDPGARTDAAATWLVLMGYGDVAALDGGIRAWEGDLETGPPPAPRPRGPAVELRIVPDTPEAASSPPEGEPGGG